MATFISSHDKLIDAVLDWIEKNDPARLRVDQPIEAPEPLSESVERPCTTLPTLEAGEIPPPAWPEEFTSYPNLGLAANNRHVGRAWCAWLLCKALDPQGSGKVQRGLVRELLSHLGVGERQQRRWLESARRIGLIEEGLDRQGYEVYYPVGPDKAKEITGCVDIWRPVKMRLADLVGPGWKRYLWAAFLLTLRGRPMSQVMKHGLTGVEPRRQRLYQAPDKSGMTWSYPRFNYSTSDVDPAHVEGIREVTGWNYFVSGKVVRQRLPDSRWLTLGAFGIAGVGKRTRKLRARAHEEPSLQSLKKGPHASAGHYQGNDDGAIFRLFHAKRPTARNYLRKLQDVPIDQQPLDVFVALKRAWRVNTWEAMSHV